MGVTQARAVVIASSAEFYGSDRMTIEAVRCLVSTFDVLAILPQKGPLGDWLEALGARVWTSDDYVIRRTYARPIAALRLTYRMLKFVWSAYRRLREEGTSVVVSNTLSVWVGVPLAKALRVPHVWYVHETLHGSALSFLVRRLMSIGQQYVIANSRYTSTQTAVTAPATVIYNSVAPFERRVTAKASTVTVLVPGRIRYSKGSDLAISAFRRCREAASSGNVRMVLRGGAAPGAADEYDQIVRDGLAHGVSVEDPTESREELYAGADIVLVPSRRPEGFSLVAAEAMVIGLPVIAFGHGGLVEFMMHGRNGWLVPVERGADGIAEAVLHLIDRPEVRARLGEQARRDAVRLFAPDVFGRSFREVVSGARA